MMSPGLKALEFIMIVGVGSTFILDLWGLLVSKVTRAPVMNWGLPGRWLMGLLKGQFVLQDRRPETDVKEQALGWIFHYAVGIAYAAMLILFWGDAYRQHPTFFPVFLIGVVLATLAGLFILIPGLGGGVCASKTPAPLSEIKSLIIAHFVFALAQYGLALCIM